jgi:hypothetical protein
MDQLFACRLRVNEMNPASRERSTQKFLESKLLSTACVYTLLSVTQIELSVLFLFLFFLFVLNHATWSLTGRPDGEAGFTGTRGQAAIVGVGGVVGLYHHVLPAFCIDIN